MRARHLLALVSVLAGCGGAEIPEKTQPVDVGLHAQVTDRASGVVLRFDSVLGDSRCPLGVLCIAAGNATVRVTAKGFMGSTTLVLSTNPDSTTRFAQGWFVQLIDLNPHPQQDPPQYIPPFVTLLVRPALD